MKILAFLLGFTGSLLIYLSHPNQQIFRQFLPRSYRYTGLIFILLALPVFLFVLPKLVAVCMWLMTLLVAWSFLPFIPLFKRYVPHESADSTKDST